MDELNTTTGTGVTETDESLLLTRKKKITTKSAVIGKGKPLIIGMCSTLIYYHCAYRNSSIISLLSDVFIVLLCSLAILGLLFRQMNIQYVFNSIFRFFFFLIWIWILVDVSWDLIRICDCDLVCCRVPVDPLEWQISQDTANSLFACLANTVGAAESVLRVAATGHDKRLFLKVISAVIVICVSMTWGLLLVIVIFIY